MNLGKAICSSWVNHMISVSSSYASMHPVSLCSFLSSQRTDWIRGVLGLAVGQAFTSFEPCTKLLLVWLRFWVHVSQYQNKVSSEILSFNLIKMLRTIHLYGFTLYFQPCVIPRISNFSTITPWPFSFKSMQRCPFIMVKQHQKVSVI